MWSDIGVLGEMVYPDWVKFGTLFDDFNIEVNSYCKILIWECKRLKYIDFKVNEVIIDNR